MDAKCERNGPRMYALFLRIRGHDLLRRQLYDLLKADRKDIRLLTWTREKRIRIIDPSPNTSVVWTYSKEGITKAGGSPMPAVCR